MAFADLRSSGTFQLLIVTSQKTVSSPNHFWPESLGLATYFISK